MYVIKSTKNFSKWLSKLKDVRGRIAIARRIERMENDNFGDVKSVGTHISELRIYFTKKEEKIIILLVGGDKSTQSKDIKKAEELLEEYEDEQE